jgi:hypothetical protein
MTSSFEYQSKDAIPECVQGIKESAIKYSK